VALIVTALAMLGLTAAGMRPLWPATPLTPSQAVGMGDDAAYVRLITSGADPHASYSVGRAFGASPVRPMTPLEAAVVRGRETQLATVLKMGVSLSGDVGRQAICLAYEESPGLIPMLVREGAPPTEQASCPPAKP
jgi:hypothetical protein